jgi:hypothetical protein
LQEGCRMRTFWSCPSPFISAARSTAASAATILFAKSSGEAEALLLFPIVPPVAMRWSGWPAVAIASWSWAHAMIRFRSLHVSSFDGLQFHNPRQSDRERLTRKLARSRPRCRRPSSDRSACRSRDPARCRHICSPWRKTLAGTPGKAWQFARASCRARCRQRLW